jgi:uncharacterized protein YcbX
VAGIVSALWRYPVKSMLGEECAEVELETRGVRGDRRFAVRGDDGRLGSGKNSRRHRHIEGLFTFRSRYHGEFPEITFPDGRRMRADDAAIDAALSETLRTPVTLVREQGIPHFDSGPIHLVSSTSLEWLRSRLPGSRIDERRFRPNLLVTSGESEQAWIGRMLHIGEVRLRVTDPTERCGMTTFAQSDLPFDPKILRSIAQEADQLFGVYAEVVQPGRISRGDAVTIGP